jgi:oligoribonuclease NrnB/cAMP/cGMP phosphodiesterase (DHH superfamily)
MGKRKELKIFRKPSIEYLKKMYSKSVSYVFDKNSWTSTSPETYGESRILLHTRKSIKRLGNELKIFKAPSIVGIKIIYYKSIGFVFDRYRLEHQMALISEENYLLRDLSSSAEYLNEKEWKIFKLPTIDKLESLYYKSIGKL